MTGHTQFPKTSVTADGRYSPRNECGWLLAAPRGIARGEYLGAALHSLAPGGNSISVAGAFLLPQECR